MEYLSYENDKHAAIIQKAFFGYTTRKMLTEIKDQYNSIFEQIEGPNSDLAVYWPSNSTTHDTEECNINKKFFICKPQILRREEIKKIKEKNEQLIKEKEENMIKIMKTENTERLESPNFIKPIETKSKFGSSFKSEDKILKDSHDNFFIASEIEQVEKELKEELLKLKAFLK